MEYSHQYGKYMFPDCLPVTPEEDQLKQCFCVGPKNGAPLCPCEMKHIIVKDGRWVRPEQDLGPAVKSTFVEKEGK